MFHVSLDVRRFDSLNHFEVTRYVDDRDYQDFHRSEIDSGHPLFKVTSCIVSLNLRLSSAWSKNKTWKRKLVDIKVLFGLSGFGWDPINCTVTADKEVSERSSNSMLLELLGDEGANGDNMRVCSLYSKPCEFDCGQSDQNYQSTASTQVLTGTPVVPTADPTTAPATGTSSVIHTTGNHTFTQTRMITLTVKSQKTRPTAHVLDTGINVMTTELSRITLKLVVRREFDWSMGSKVEIDLRGITGFDMTHLFTALEVITKEKPFVFGSSAQMMRLGGVIYVLGLG
ncbi:hypothetical protein GIB67_020750 [Kingdonia uniflora]|uniref:Myb/SANT-like domain-containing protein n=1 Tax=Kingdonia uniflora TaxID=39325 RepID=A0A7J7M711_9MAGN|nr:hypothetical protein GIB67_020750 [Kingdonia uniflora]